MSSIVDPPSGVGIEWVGCPACEWCGHPDGQHENGCRLGVGPDEVAEHQWNALEMARKADLAETERDAALAEVERLRDVLTEVRAVFDIQCPPMLPDKYVDRGAWMAHSWWNTVLGNILKRGALLTGLAAAFTDTVVCPCGEPVGHAHHCDSCCGCAVGDQHEHMAKVEHLRRCPMCDMRFSEGCNHEWLDRPESDTRECLVCGVEVAG